MLVCTTPSSRMVPMRSRCRVRYRPTVSMSSRRTSVPKRSLRLARADLESAGDAAAPAIDLAIVELLELIAILGVERVREVGEQIELVVDGVGVGLVRPGPGLVTPLGAEAVAMRFAAVRAGR